MKLKINIWSGIFDIVATVFYSTVPFIRNKIVFGYEPIISLSTFSFFVLCFSLTGLILHIIALNKSKKVGISPTGNTLGIIANVIVPCLGSELSAIAMILSILSAVFTLKQKQVDNK